MPAKKKTGGVPDANRKTPPAVLEQLHRSQDSSPAEAVKKKFQILEKPHAAPAAGSHGFVSVADWMRSLEFAALAEQGRVTAEQRKRTKASEYRRRYDSRKRAGLPMNAAAFCRIAFHVPRVPCLPAPGQVVRWPAETIYSPIKAKGSTPRRYRPDHKRPQWQIDTERIIIITPQEFGHLVQALGMTAEDCAAYLRVSVATVRAWECGDEAIPFSAYWLLRLTIKADRFNTRFPEWEGWGIAEDGPDAGKLIDANRSAAFTPQEIACIPSAWHQAAFHTQRADRLQSELSEAIAENTRLRKLFQEQGVTRELRDMQQRIGALLEGVGTADLIELHTPPTAIRAKEKAA